jgi:hypothetical protein
MVVVVAVVTMKPLLLVSVTINTITTTTVITS